MTGVFLLLPLLAGQPHELALDRDAPLAEGLVLWLPAGHAESYGTLTWHDLSGREGQNGLLAGMPADAAWRADGRLAVEFSGDEQVVMGRLAEPLTPPLTLSLWCCPDDVTWRSMLVLSDAEDTRQLRLWWAGGDHGLVVHTVNQGVRTGVSGPAVEAGEWRHLAVTLATDGILRLYLDGQDVASSRWARQVWLDRYRVGDAMASVGGYAGRVDDLRVWSRVLSAEEVGQLYRETVKGGYGSTAGWGGDQPPDTEWYGYALPVNGYLFASSLVDTSDPEGGPLRCELEQTPWYGDITLHPDGLFFYVPVRGFEGLDEFKLRVVDQAGGEVVTRIGLGVGVPVPAEWERGQWESE